MTETLRAEYKQYRRTQIAEMADWEPGFDMCDVSVSAADASAGSPKLGDKIARNPANHLDRWLVAKAYFETNFEALQAGRESASKGEGQELARLLAEINHLANDGSVHDFTVAEIRAGLRDALYAFQHAPSSPGSEREAGRWVSIDEHRPCPKCHHVHPVGAVTLAHAYTRCTYSGPGPMETCNCNFPIDDFVNEDGI